MKRISAITLIIIISLAFAGCQKEANPIAPPETTPDISINYDLLKPTTFSKDSQKLSYEVAVNDKNLTIPYRLYAPEGVQNLPILLFLHGSGECGSDNNLQLERNAGWIDNLTKDLYKSYPCIIIAPHIPDEPTGTTKEILESYVKLLNEISEKYSADKNRIYVTGLSMGGDAIWKILELYPEYFAAALPISGGMFNSFNVENYTKTPIWAFQGELDLIYSTKKIRDLVYSIEQAGGNIKYTEYKGGSHVIWAKAYSDPEIYKWIFEQKRDS